MKIYVENLPKNCADCPCRTYNEYWDESYCNVKDNTIEDIYEKQKNCPLQSLSDYTKQVRKEVLGELMNMLGDRAELIDFGNGCAEFMFTTYDLQECSKVILDKIQGE